MRVCGVLPVVLVVGCGGGVVIVNNPPPPEAAPAMVVYAPSATRYASRQARHIEQEVNGQTMSNDTRTVVLFSADLVGEAEAMTATFTIDSIASTIANISAARVASAKGATFTGRFAPTGQIDSLKGNDEALGVLRQLGQGFPSLYPTLPDGGAVPGTTWTDTTTRKVDTSALQLTIVTTAQHQAVEFTEFDGERALRIESEGTYTLNGTGQQAGQQLTLDGTGRRHTTSFISQLGRFLGSMSSDSANIDVLLDAYELIVPVVQTGRDTVSVVR